MDFWVYGFRFIEIVKGLGANKFWPKRFERNVLSRVSFWNHVLELVGLGLGRRWD